MGDDDFIPDDDFEPDPPQMQGKVEHPENFLQRAIKNSRIGQFGGTSITAALPADGQEAMDLGKDVLRNVAGPSQGRGLVGVGANMSDPAGSFREHVNDEEFQKKLAPETPYGKNMDAAIKVAPFAEMGLSGIAPAAGGIKSLVNSFRTSPIKNKISSIEELILKSKQSEIPIKEQMGRISEASKYAKESGAKAAEKAAYEGSKGVKEQRVGRFRDANQRFGEEFSKLESKMADEDLAKVIKNAANDIGAADIPGTPGNSLMNKISKYGPKSEPGVEQFKPKIYNKEEVQAITKEILDSLPDDRSKAIFHKHLVDALPESVPGLKELKASHAPVYDVAKESKNISKGALKRVARGAASDTEVTDLSKAGERLGTSHVERAKKVAKTNNLQKMMLEQQSSHAEKRLAAKGDEQAFLKGKIPELERKIKDVRFRQYAAGAGASLIGLGPILRHLFGFDNNKPNQ